MNKIEWLESREEKGPPSIIIAQLARFFRVGALRVVRERRAGAQ